MFTQALGLGFLIAKIYAKNTFANEITISINPEGTYPSVTLSNILASSSAKEINTPVAIPATNKLITNIIESTINDNNAKGLPMPTTNPKLMPILLNASKKFRVNNARNTPTPIIMTVTASEASPK